MKKTFAGILCVSVLVLFAVYLRTRHQKPPGYDKERLREIKAAAVSASLTQHGSSIHGNPADSSTGRTAEDGRWLSEIRPYELYMYTAFLDARLTLKGTSYIRVIAVMEMRERMAPECAVWYLGDDQDEQPEIIKAELLKIGFGVFRHNKFFQENIVSCKIPNSEKIPVAVSVSLARSSHMVNVLPVEIPRRAEPEVDFIVCVSVAYWNHDPYRLVEWIEMQRILGAKSIKIYNNSLSREAGEVFLHYSREGLVELRQSHNFLPDLGELTIHLHMSPVLNDCLYRNMHATQKLVIVDLDEVIVPHRHDDWASMLSAMESQLPREHYNPYRSYVFKNSYFFLDIPPDESQPKQTTFLRHRKRTATVQADVSIKSIVDPKICVQLHNHACWTRTEARDISQEVDVDPSYGLNQHYKRCHFDNFEGVVGKCQSLCREAFQDDVMLRFKTRLLNNMDAHLRKLHLDPIFPD